MAIGQFSEGATNCSRKMSKSGQDDFVTLGAAALLTGLLIFIAGREQKRDESSDESSKDCDQDALAASHARIPADEPIAIQKARAAQPGRGRAARRPRAVPWRGWKDILWRTWAGITDDHLLTLAGGVAFFALLAMVPALTAGVSSYALFADAHAIQGQLNLLANIVPPTALDLVRDEIIRIVANSNGRLTLSFLGSLALSLWSANSGVKALFEALNILYGEEEKRSIVQLNVLSMLLTICSIAAMLMIVTGVVVLPLVFSITGFLGIKLTIIALLRWPAMLILAMVAFGVLYRYGPSRRLVQAHWITLGSLMAAFLWLAMSATFSWYLSHVANYTATYGALGAVIGLMMWMWLSAVIVLVGAKLNAEIEHQTAEDTTVGAPKPLGSRGAVMADTVGRAVM
ncbi:MAG: YihY/virulence factor BrkB family protein [Xanthobacteraceae bacterium]